MPLSLYCGPFASLEKSFVSHLTVNPPGVGRRVAVVTTSQRMAERLQRLLTQERGHAFFNLRFHTLHSLASEVLRSSGVPLPDVINEDLFHERLVEQLLVESGHFDARRARALAEAHRATVRDLVEAGVETSSFREYFSDMDIPGEGKLFRLLSLADRYRERLSSLNVAGSADLARLAAVTVENHPTALESYDELVYYGFYDLNGAQSDFFNAVAQQARVRLYFPCVKGQAGWAFAERFLELKIRVGGAEAHQDEARDERPLGGVLRSLFNPGAAPGEPSRNVQIANVSGERDEIWRVAKEILKLREGKNPPDWDEIGLVARGLDAYTTLVPELLGVHGIPYSLSDGGPLLSHPVVRLAIDLIELPGRTHERDILADILGSPWIHRDVFSGSSPDEVRRYFLQAGPRAGLAHVVAPPPPTENSEISEDLRGPVLPLALQNVSLRLRDSGPPGHRSWADHGVTARERLETMIDRNPDTEAVLQQIFGILDSLVELDRFSPPVSGEEFASTFVDALRKARRPGTGPVHGVRVMGAMEARGERFGTLFLVGLKEGVFPRVVREDPLLGDDIRRVLRDPGGYWILPKREGYDEEKLLFTLLVSSVTERLFLLFSRSGDEGRAEVPSIYLRDLARAAGLSLDEAERLPRPPLEKWSALPPALLTSQEAGLADLLEGRAVFGPLEKIAERAAHLLWRGGPTAIDGWVGPPQAYVEKCRERGISPSSLETLVSCPFEFFLSRILGLRDPRAMFDADGVIPLALGKIQHAVLEKVYRAIIARGGLDPVEAAALARKETHHVFSSLGTLAGGTYPLLWLTVQDRVERQLSDFVLKDVSRLKAEGFQPKQLEWVLKAPCPGTDFMWTGRLDRVDWNETSQRFRVIDYKNSLRKESLANRILAGQVYQAPAYLDLVEFQGLWGPAAQAESVRFEYLATNTTEDFPGEVWQTEEGAIHSRLHEWVSVIQRGQFPIRPTEGPNAHCHWCDFARACRKAHGPSRRRAEENL